MPFTRNDLCSEERGVGLSAIVERFADPISVNAVRASIAEGPANGTIWPRRPAPADRLEISGQGPAASATSQIS